MKTSHKNKNLSTVISKMSVSAIALVAIFSTTLVAFASPITEENVLRNINDQRIVNNLEPLTINDDLDHAATMKSKDMINRNYFEHYAYGLSPWDFIHNAGYDYDEAGENLAMDFVTSEGMVKAWMNSPKHRENILNPDFQDVGIGIVKGEYSENEASHTTIMVTNMFGVKKQTVVQVVNNIVLQIARFFSFR